MGARLRCSSSGSRRASCSTWAAYGFASRPGRRALASRPARRYAEGSGGPATGNVAGFTSAVVRYVVCPAGRSGSSRAAAGAAVTSKLHEPRDNLRAARHDLENGHDPAAVRALARSTNAANCIWRVPASAGLPCIEPGHRARKQWRQPSGGKRGPQERCISRLAAGLSIGPRQTTTPARTNPIVQGYAHARHTATPKTTGTRRSHRGRASPPMP